MIYDWKLSLPLYTYARYTDKGEGEEYTTDCWNRSILLPRIQSAYKTPHIGGPGYRTSYPVNDG